MEGFAKIQPQYHTPKHGIPSKQVQVQTDRQLTPNETTTYQKLSQREMFQLELSFKCGLKLLMSNANIAFKTMIDSKLYNLQQSITRRNYLRVQCTPNIVYASNPNKIQRQLLHSFYHFPTWINPSKLRMPSQLRGLQHTKQIWKYIASCLGREINSIQPTVEILRLRDSSHCSQNKRAKSRLLLVHLPLSMASQKIEWNLDISR